MPHPRRPTRASLIWASSHGAAVPQDRALTLHARVSDRDPSDSVPPATERTPTVPAARVRRRPRPEAGASTPATRIDRTGARTVARGSASAETASHPLTDRDGNLRLQRYEERVKTAFDQIVPVLKQLSALRCDPDFEARAQSIVRAELGFELPAHLVCDAWVARLDLRRLFAWCLFETYRGMANEFFAQDPLGGHAVGDFDRFLQGCGFHQFDVTPCADGRLAHAISYVLRLPFGAVRRKSYAGGLFDVENTVSKWVEVELNRFREGVPNTADAPTRYLKSVIYHYSSVDPHHQGCAAHGSNDAAAAQGAIDRLMAFREAVEKSFCCGASVALLLIGLDTDTDAIRIHVPDGAGHLDPGRSVEAAKVYAITRDLDPSAARERLAELVRAHAPATADPGMLKLVARLIENNLSQIDYVRQVHGGRYRDTGHAERFMGVGIGFEEIQLRNLTYFAYLYTVEEGAADLDVGRKIFAGLNVAHGLPIPIVIRFDYHGGVPGARERAVERCRRLDAALANRFADLDTRGLLHRLLAVRDSDSDAGIEVVGSSLDPEPTGGH